MNTIHSKSPDQILIAGAGIAGLATAVVLARAGRQVDVLDRSPGPRSGGYKIDVRGSALEALRRLGLEDDARAHHLGIRAGSVVTSDGTTVAQLGGDTFGGRTGQDIELERGDLLALLTDAAMGAGVRFHYGSGVAAAQTGTGRRAEVTLQDGTRIEADLVIGADGLHSAVRAAVTTEATLLDLGYGIAVHDTMIALGLDRAEMTYVAPGRTTLVYDTGERTRAMYLFARSGPVPRERGDAIAYLRETYAARGGGFPNSSTA